MQRNAVFGLLGIRGRQHLAHKHGPRHPVGQKQPLLGQHLSNAGELLGGNTRRQVVEGNEAVGLAAAEVGLKLDDGIAPSPGKPTSSPDEQIPQPLSDVGAGEELLWILILRLSVALEHLEQVGGELGLLEVPLGHIGMGRDDFSPRGQPRGGVALGGLGRRLATLRARLLLHHLAHEVAAQVADLPALVEVAEGL